MERVLTGLNGQSYLVDSHFVGLAFKDGWDTKRCQMTA